MIHLNRAKQRICLAHMRRWIGEDRDFAADLDHRM
jgi:hypothetical protein